MTVAVILVAAGRGERLGASLPKALVSVCGKSIVEHAFSSAVQTENLSQIIVTVPFEQMQEFDDLLRPLVLDSVKFDVVVGGNSRQQSIKNAIDPIDSKVATVLVHDAARAFMPTSVFNDVAAKVAETGNGVLPVLSVHDTIKRVADGAVQETVDRNSLAVAQTPQGFPAVELGLAYETASSEYTDDAALFQAFGGTVVTVAGHVDGFKVTTPADLERAETLFGSNQLTGIGTDTHRFARDSSKPLFLGTVEWAGYPALEGHSDGDALSHAIVDALLAAAKLGDIGSNFGVDRAEFAGANGRVFLAETKKILETEGYTIVNVSAQIIGNRPKVSPMREEVETVLSELLNAPVSLGATTTDGLGFLGNSEGVAVVATALIRRSKK